MAQQPPAKRQKLTALAEKYGASPNEDLTKIDPFISGLTPLEVHPLLTAEESLRIRLIEKEQKKMFHGKQFRTPPWITRLLTMKRIYHRGAPCLRVSCTTH